MRSDDFARKVATALAEKTAAPRPPAKVDYIAWSVVCLQLATLLEARPAQEQNQTHGRQGDGEVQVLQTAVSLRRILRVGVG